MDEAEQIQKILLDLQWLRDNVNRLISNAESERINMRDKHIEINKRISDLDKLMREVFYDHEHGFLVRIDRLTQESIERRKMKNHIIALEIGLGCVVVAFILDHFFK